MGLETATLDLVARSRGVAVADLLAPDPSNPGRAAGDRVEVSALIGDALDPGLVTRARARLAEGARTLKVKLGRGAHRDVEALVELRAALGPEVALLVDANGAWSLDEARARLSALSRAGVALCEQPVPPSHLLELGPSPTAVWADESLADPSSWDRVLASPHIAGLALKPTVLGGLARARDFARRAQREGKAVAVTHALEGPIALAACGALALALADIAPRAGLWPHLALAAHPAASLPLRQATWRRSASAGLGLSDVDRVRQLELPPWPA
jgi:L-alanine-DL-glutamate epimerase-like enolase superfamily enzyme